MKWQKLLENFIDFLFYLGIMIPIFYFITDIKWSLATGFALVLGAINAARRDIYNLNKKKDE